MFKLRRPDCWLWTSAALFAALYAVLASARFRGYNTGMLDLGNMSQAIWSVVEGQALRHTNPAGNVSRLGGHVELIYFALAPLMVLWASPVVLVVAQAVLFASAAFPVYAMACRRLPPFASFCFALGYLLYPTAVNAVLFDLHGDTLALPLLLWMLDGLDRRSLRQFWLFLGLSLLCKFYIAAPVFALGLTLLFARTAPFGLAHLPNRRRLGLLVCAVATLYGLLAVLGIRPFFATAATNGATAYTRYYFGAITAIGVIGVLDRVLNVLAVLTPSAFLWWRALTTAAPAFAIIGPALLSTGPGAAYAWSYHHYAAAVPFIVAGSIMGAARLVEQTKNARLRQRNAVAVGALFLGASLVFHVGLNDTPLGLTFWRSEPGFGLSPGSYGRTSRDALKDRWLAEAVPSGVPLAASNFLAPHLFKRDSLYLVRYPDEPTAARLPQILPQVQLAIPDALFDFVQRSGAGFVGGVAYDVDAIRQLLQARTWGLTAARDGLLRFEREPQPERVLQQRITRVADSSAAQARFADVIELVQSRVDPLGERRYQATFRWRALRDFQPDEQFVAVSALEGVPHNRMAHLPSYALQPTTTWRAGDVWEEQWEVQVPDGVAGSHALRVGWYDTRNLYAAETDARSRIGDEVVITVLELP
ncbi:MAG: DUF2079 domain-containing protein [Chloroflexota bacterium]|nr:DUF2079 domain-containing protein [Chloroflexota bacterium]